MNKNLYFTFLISCSLLLVSCNKNNAETFEVDASTPGSATIKIYKNNESTSTSRFIPPSRVNIKNTYQSLSGMLSNTESVCPSIGDVNLLVIPVHFEGYEEYKTDKVRSDIEKIFFSTNDQSLGFKSVKDYYYESSYGKLNFSGTVTDWFDVSNVVDDNGNKLINSDSDITSGTSGTIIKILEQAVSWAKSTQNINLRDFDQDGDGNIDAVWLVYDHLDWDTKVQLEYHKTQTYDTSSVNSSFWNFTGWDTNTYANLIEPTTSSFSWASFDMMYINYCSRFSDDTANLTDLDSISLDSHTFIHETGHLLGLDDYYNSSNSSYSPAGKTTMMDQNIYDLDSYSKMLLGWVTPYVVYGTSEIIIPKATSSDHAVIVIPSNFEEISASIEDAISKGTINDFTYDFNPFSEYLLIDVYTPDGLNAQDTYGPYIYGESGGATSTGVRIYHIDSRIFKCTYVEYDGGYTLVYDEDNYEWNGKKLKNNEYILMPISNNLTESSSYFLPLAFDYYDQIRLLEATNINSFSSGGRMSNSTLFTTESSPFNIVDYGYQFFNANYTFDDGNDLPFYVKVETLEEITQ